MRAAPDDLPILAATPGLTSRLTHCGEVDVAVETFLPVERERPGRNVSLVLASDRAPGG